MFQLFDKFLYIAVTVSISIRIKVKIRKVSIKRRRAANVITAHTAAVYAGSALHNS